MAQVVLSIVVLVAALINLAMTWASGEGVIMSVVVLVLAAAWFVSEAVEQPGQRKRLAKVPGHGRGGRSHV